MSQQINPEIQEYSGTNLGIEIKGVGDTTSWDSEFLWEPKPLVVPRFHSARNMSLNYLTISVIFNFDELKLIKSHEFQRFFNINI
jgi:hypothetical protein